MRRAEKSGRTRHNHRAPARPLVRIGRMAGKPRRRPFARNKTQRNAAVQAGRDSDVRYLQIAYEIRARKCEMSALGEAQRHGEIRADAQRIRRAGIGVQAGWQIHRRHERKRAPRLRRRQFAENVRERAADGTRSASPKHGVYDDVSARQRLVQPRRICVVAVVARPFHASACRRVHLGIVGGTPSADVRRNRRAPSREMPRRHKPVPTVVASPNERDDSNARQMPDLPPNGAREREPGVLHERVGGYARALRARLYIAHLVGGYDFHDVASDTAAGRLPAPIGASAARPPPRRSTDERFSSSPAALWERAGEREGAIDAATAITLPISYAQ